jgi:copper(I)-binding protein
MALKLILAAASAALLALPALAGEMGLKIVDPYARSSAQSGAAFFIIENHSDQDDRLVAARAEVAGRVEMHTHHEDANGVMRMREIEGGIIVPAHGRHALERGGDHLMFMGLSEALPEGESITVTLTFEQAGDVVVEIPVTNDREAGSGGSGHGGMSHGTGHGGQVSN